MRNEEPPLWQTAPKEWKPIKVLLHASNTVVGGREAKKEQTTTVVQGAYHLQLDKEYVDNQRDPTPFIPLCHANARGPYLDVRIYRALVFLFQVQSQCNAGHYSSFLNDLQDRTAADRHQNYTGNTIAWFRIAPTTQYWNHAAGWPETTITITTEPGPHGGWVDIRLDAHSADKYHVVCKHHKCPRPTGRDDIFIHVHGLAKVRPEVQDAMEVLLAELYANDAPADMCPVSGARPVQLRPMPVSEGPRTYLEPCLEPGIHFHTAPDLATVRGYICAMDVGNPDAKSRGQARGEEVVDDPEGMAAANV